MSKRSKSELVGAIGELLRTNQLAQDLFDDAAADRLGVNRTGLRILDILDQEGPMPIGRLACKNRLSPAAVTAAVDLLEEAGYARRVRDSEDRRQVVVELTEKLEPLVEQIWGPFGEVTLAEFGSFSLTELETIARFLDRSKEILTEHEDRVRALSPGQAQDCRARSARVR